MWILLSWNLTSIFFVLSQIESLRVMQRMEGVDVTTSATADYQCHMEPLSSPALRRDCRLYSLTESGIFVNAEGNTMDADQEVVRLDQREEEEEEPSEVCHQTSTGLPLTLEPDSPFPCPMDTIMHSSGRPLHMLTSTPGATSTHSQEDGELLDSGIVSSMEQLSLESHDADSCIDEDTFSPMVTMATSKSSQMTPFQRKCSSMRVKGSQSSNDGHTFDRNRSKSLPGSSKKKRTKREVKSAPIRREKPENAQKRRTSETALIYTVNISAALAYAAVSNLFKWLFVHTKAPPFGPLEHLIRLNSRHFNHDTCFVSWESHDARQSPDDKRSLCLSRITDHKSSARRNALQVDQVLL